MQEIVAKYANAWAKSDWAEMRKFAPDAVVADAERNAERAKKHGVSTGTLVPSIEVQDRDRTW